MVLKLVDDIVRWFGCCVFYVVDEELQDVVEERNK